VPDWIPERAEFIHGSVLDGAVVKRALRGVDFVFHQAAFTGFDHHATRYLDLNARATTSLFDALADDRGAVRKVVVASSLSVYGEGKYRCRGDGVQHPAARSTDQLARHEWEPKCPSCQQA